MNVIVTINGREAIPVRAIPLLTDWGVLTPDYCAKAFAGQKVFAQSFVRFQTYRLNADGGCDAVAPRWWANWIVRELDACNEHIKTTEADHESGYQQWRRESLALLPAGVFVWRDEFEAAYLREYGPNSMRAQFSGATYDEARYTLNFNPEHGPGEDWRNLVMECFDSLFANMQAPASIGDATPSQGQKPVQRHAAQEAQILEAIRNAGFDPLALPIHKPGKPGVKAQIRAALQNPLFIGSTVFDKAWERLRKSGSIMDAAYPSP